LGNGQTYGQTHRPTERQRDALENNTVDADVKNCCGAKLPVPFSTFPPLSFFLSFSLTFPIPFAARCDDVDVCTHQLLFCCSTTSVISIISHQSPALHDPYRLGELYRHFIQPTHTLRQRRAVPTSGSYYAINPEILTAAYAVGA